MRAGPTLKLQLKGSVVTSRHEIVPAGPGAGDARHSTSASRPDPDTLGSAHSLANRSSDSAACPRLVRAAQATRLNTSRDQLGDARLVDDLFVPKQQA
jgi:hypothetical protein